MLGREVLSAQLDAEYEGHVNQSVVNHHRNWLDDAMVALPVGSGSYASFSAMREACNEYLRATPDPIAEPFTHLRPHFRKALQRLRAEFRLDLSNLAHALDLDEARAVARRIPSNTRAFPQVSPGPVRTIYVAPP
jgi:hypothetical protein